MRLRLIATLAIILLVPTLAQAAPAMAPADVVYTDVIRWGMQLQTTDIRKNRTRIDDANERLERAAYRYGIIKEFAMAVVATEGYFAPKVSYARSDSWAVYQKATNYKMGRYPDVMTDLDTSLSTLAAAMQKGKTVNEVLTLYWCGPNKSMNADTAQQFITYVNKIYNGLEPYARQRLQAERSGKVKPSAGLDNYRDFLDDDYNGWGGAVPNNDGFVSMLGTRPMRLEEMKYFKGDEEAYARTAKKFNKNLSDKDARTIARAILNYCAKTNWSVDPRLVMAVVAAESAFRPNAVSGVGALGLGQLMPATARAYGVSNPFDPVQNLYGCVKYIEREQHRWGKKPELIFAAYNAGPGAVKKYKGVPPYRETQNYVVTVKKYYNRFAPKNG